jgi:hypothetical protein
MAKGFIEKVRRGGVFQKDKAVYGLVNEWTFWTPGMIIRVKPKGNNAGRPTHEENLSPHVRTHTHPHNRTPKQGLRVRKRTLWPKPNNGKTP